MEIGPILCESCVGIVLGRHCPQMYPALMFSSFGGAHPSAQDSVLGEHPYVKLLLLSLAASCASSALFTMHYTMFMYDGFGSKRLRFLAMFSAIVATVGCVLELPARLTGTSLEMSKRRGREL